MIRCNFHTHTTYVDGRNTPEEMVQAALTKGFTTLGFSEHGYESIDSDPCWMTLAQTEDYANEIAALKAKYAGRIDLYCGLELDALGDYPDRARWDYTIGSAHVVPSENGLVNVDFTPEMQKEGIARCFHGDPYAFAAAYFALVADMAESFHPSILGHFDLVTKFNERCPLLDTQDPRYTRPALAALSRCIDTGAIVEINTGAMARGFRTTPYPALALLREVKALGGRIIISADAHSAQCIDYAFADAVQLAQAAGFSESMTLTPEGFCPLPF